MKTKHNPSSVFLVVCFGLFLAGIMIITTVWPKQTYSYYENRNLATMPEISGEALLSGQWGADMDKYLADHVAARKVMLAADAALNVYLLRQPLVNEVVITEDCLLPEIADWMVYTSEVEEKSAQMTENLVSLKDLTQSYGGNYYYVAVPCQYAFYNDRYPWYVNNREAYTQKSIEVLSADLEEAGVNFIDIGGVYEEHGWAEHLSSTIDNHYTIHGAYLTYLEIMERINADTGLDLEILDDGEYHIEELPNPYMGSRTRKLLGLWPSDERVEILIPNEQVEFVRKDNHKEVEPTVYALPADEKVDVLYSVYMGGDIALTEIDTGREELPSILVYGDSFTNAAECILYYGFDKMYSIDMRHNTQTTLGEFIAEYQPEIVVCIRDYEALFSTSANGSGA